MEACGAPPMPIRLENAVTSISTGKHKPRPVRARAPSPGICELAYKCTYMGQRTIGGIKKLGREDIARIYEMAR